MAGINVHIKSTRCQSQDLSLTSPLYLQGYFTYKKTHPSQDPTVGLCLGSDGVPRGLGGFLWVRCPCRFPTTQNCRVGFRNCGQPTRARSLRRMEPSGTFHTQGRRGHRNQLVYMAPQLVFMTPRIVEGLATFGAEKGKRDV